MGMLVAESVLTIISSHGSSKRQSWLGVCCAGSHCAGCDWWYGRWHHAGGWHAEGITSKNWWFMRKLLIFEADDEE